MVIEQRNGCIFFAMTYIFELTNSNVGVLIIPENCLRSACIVKIKLAILVSSITQCDFSCMFSLFKPGKYFVWRQRQHSVHYQNDVIVSNKMLRGNIMKLA